MKLGEPRKVLGWPLYSSTGRSPAALLGGLREDPEGWKEMMLPHGGKCLKPLIHRASKARDLGSLSRLHYRIQYSETNPPLGRMRSMKLLYSVSVVKSTRLHFRPIKNCLSTLAAGQKSSVVGRLRAS